ncbi:MAG: CPBP family intramembrane metalloprotease [Oscillospiraceae bacterium]|nr:CPBP family intramembrane metalloprotease [Oscillospiraceae bacterium]
MKKNHDLGARLSTPQVILGWCYLPVYLFLLGWGIQKLFGILGLEGSPLMLNSVFFCTNFAVVVLGFASWLKRSFRSFTEHFWAFIQTLILGFALYYFTQLILSTALMLIFGEKSAVNNEVVGGLVYENSTLMALFLILLAPLTEEVLIRGVVFGSLHKVNRYLAYVASILLFSFMHVWQYFVALDFVTAVYNLCLYLPAGIALGWTYEKSGTIWCPVVLHAIINAIAYGVMIAL